MPLPRTPHNPLLQFTLATRPTVAAAEEELRDYRLEDLYTQEELTLCKRELWSTSPIRLQDWARRDREGPAPMDEEVAAWTRAQGIDFLYEQLAIRDPDDAEPPFRHAWQLLFTQPDRHLLEALAMSVGRPEYIIQLLPDAGPFSSLETLGCYFSRLHCASAMAPADHEAWVKRLERRAQGSTIYRTEALAKRMAITYPREGKKILAFYPYMGREYGIKALIRDTKRTLLARMLFESANPDPADNYRRLNLLTVNYERLERIAPEPPEIDAEPQVTLQLIHGNDDLLSRDELAASGRLAQRNFSGVDEHGKPAAGAVGSAVPPVPAAAGSR